MKKADIKVIESLADDAITAMRAARAATLEAKDALAPGTAPELLKAAMDKSVAAHEEAVSYTGILAAKVQGLGADSFRKAIGKAVEAVQAAKIAMDEYRANAGPATEPKVLKADDDAVTRLMDAKAAFQWSPEVEKIATSVDWTAWVDWGLRILFALIGILITVFLWKMSTALFGDGPLMGKLAQPEYARGMITFLVSVGTVTIAGVLVLAILLGGGGDAEEKKAARAKDVLSVLVGIFGTILGYYFGTEKTTGKPQLELSPIVATRFPDGTNARVALTVTGGKAPYTYSLAFADSGIPAIKDQPSSDGRISQTVTNLTNTNALSYTLTIEDANKMRLEHKATDLEKIPKKE